MSKAVKAAKTEKKGAKSLSASPQKATEKTVIFVLKLLTYRTDDRETKVTIGGLFDTEEKALAASDEAYQKCVSDTSASGVQYEVCWDFGNRKGVQEIGKYYNDRDEFDVERHEVQ